MSTFQQSGHRLRGAVLASVRTWLPVALALVVAIAAGASIMWLNASSYRASQARDAVPALSADLVRPEALLLQTSAARLAATGRGTLAPTPGVPEHMAAYYTGTFQRIESIGASTGEGTRAATVVRALRDLATTQDAVYAGGSSSRPAARHAPAAVAALQRSLVVLEARLGDRARLAGRLAAGGTMLIMVIGALSLIVLLRRFDRMRGRLADELHELATHDPLTALANRRQLASDLAHAARSASTDRPVRLVMFDLDGFKAYNDAFGHHGGDLLLRRLGQALALAAGPDGTSYRLGGDEFCVLLSADADAGVVARCATALGESGEGFSIVASYGTVELPREASDPDIAMQLADERMYACKTSTRTSAGEQTRSLALKILGIQEPDVESHSAKVAELAGAVARRLGLAENETIEVVRAAELHDIGKIAIPYAVLHKAGPLDEQEWEMVRRHPTTGASILSAAPALAGVAEIVRHSHERYDGLGYPLGLAADRIPLASRIVFVCDSFDAMVARRSYSPSMSEEGAIDELRRNAGTQFDPAVVEAFAAVRAERRARVLEPRRAVAV